MRILFSLPVALQTYTASYWVVLPWIPNSHLLAEVNWSGELLTAQESWFLWGFQLETHGWIPHSNISSDAIWHMKQEILVPNMSFGTFGVRYFHSNYLRTRVLRHHGNPWERLAGVVFPESIEVMFFKSISTFNSASIWGCIIINVLV